MLSAFIYLPLLLPGRQDPAFPGLGCADYSVENYQIKLRFDPATGILNGDAIMSAKVVYPISEIPIDLSGLEVDSVTVSGKEAKFHQSQDKLLVDTSAGRSAGGSFEVETIYHGSPKAIPCPATFGLAVGWFSYEGGAVAVCEPNAAHTWFPCNDLPTEKAKLSLQISCPPGYTVISNGKETQKGDVTEWSLAEPSLPCMATVAIGKFSEVDENGPGGLKIRNYVPHGEQASYKPILDTENSILTLLESKLGPYPWETCGTISLPGEVGTVSPLMQSAALETTTIPVFGPGLVKDKATLTHELCHQWMGNCVSVTHWAEDIWWVEGFAAYSEQLLVENDKGHSAYLNSIHRVAEHNAGSWVAPGKLSVATMFGNGSYVSGCLLFHSLRTELGDDAFFKVIREFIARHKYGNATDQDWIDLASKAAGRDMKPFFEKWLYGTQQPQVP